MTSTFSFVTRGSVSFQDIIFYNNFRSVINYILENRKARLASTELSDIFLSIIFEQSSAGADN